MECGSPAGFARESPTGFGRPCEVCGEPMLASLSGRGYCLPCGVPNGDFPLVPVSATPQEFLRIQTAWQHPHNRRCLAVGSDPGSLPLVEDEREPPLLTARRVTPGKPQRGRHLSMDEAAQQKLRWMVQQPGWTLEMLAERFVDERGKNPHPRTIRRALKRLGLTLKKGRHPSLDEMARQKLRRMVQQPGWTLEMLAERFVNERGKNPHPRTIRRALKRLGLTLKKDAQTAWVRPAESERANDDQYL
jgi:transposase